MRYLLFIWLLLATCSVSWSQGFTILSPKSGDQWAKGDTKEIRWQTSLNASRVRIEYYRISRFETIVSSTPNDGSYNWEIPRDLTAGEYRIRVSLTTSASVANSGWTEKFKIVDTSNPGTSCFLPTNIKWDKNQNDIKISWQRVSNAGYYSVRFRVKGTSNWKSKSSFIQGNVSNIIIPVDDLLPGTDYEYQVQTTCSGNKSDLSAVGTFSTNNFCIRPDDTSVTDIITDQATIRWTGVSNASGYLIQYKEKGESWSRAVDRPASRSRTSNTLYGLKPGTVYQYRMRAGCSGNESDYTSIEEFKTKEESSYSISGNISYGGTGEDISGVRINFGSKSAYTDTRGNYKLEGFEEGLSGELKPIKTGITFSPASVNINSISQDLVRNFTGRLEDDQAARVTLSSLSSGAYTATDKLTLTWESSNQVSYELRLYQGNSPIGFLKSRTTSAANGFVWDISDGLVNGQKVEAGIDYSIKITVFGANGTQSVSTTEAFEILSEATNPFTDLEASHKAYEAILFLFSEGIITGDGQNPTVRPDAPLNRGELAALLYKSLRLTPSNAFADYFPSPFRDLQDPLLWYYSYAKNLSYLQYDDQITPFDRNYLYFNPGQGISNQHALKALLEAWDFTLTTSGSQPYSGVDPDMRKYYITAIEEGLVSDDTDNGLLPIQGMKRSDIFLLLYAIIKEKSLNPPTVGYEDFYVPGIHSLKTMGRLGGMIEGEFNYAEKPSFQIPSIGMPLSFAHAYHSQLTELPDLFQRLKPLGEGWTHNYNIYLIRKDDALNQSATVAIRWGSGILHAYDADDLNDLQPITLGVYDQLEYLGSSRYELRTKDQKRYRFEKPTGSAPDFPYVLTSIKDRNGNEIKLRYEASPQENQEFRLYSVIGTAGRSLRFSYASGSDKVSRISESGILGRSVKFDYKTQEDGTLLLKNYSNKRNLITRYAYSSENGEKGLLKTITQPKGNVIDNTYEKRRLRSTSNQVAGSVVKVNPQPKYSSNDPGAFHTSTITESLGGEQLTTTYRIDNLKRLRASFGSEGRNEIDYTDAQNPTLATEIESQTGVTSKMKFDDRGNLLQVDLPRGVTFKYEYYATNELRKYYDGNNVATSFSIDGNGNVTEIQGPRGTTGYKVDGRGLITSVTNPLQQTISFKYDGYGNLTETQAPEGIKSSSTYDRGGRILSQTNPLSHRYTYAWDNNNNLLSVKNPLPAETRYAFDQNDNLASITNANNGVTRVGYDSKTDFPISETFAGNTRNYKYYPDGALELYQKADGTALKMEYDGAGNLTSDGIRSFTYGARNRLETIIKGSQQIKYTYDALNRVETISTNGKTVRYEYDGNSNVTDIYYPGADNKRVRYDYHDDNLLKSVTDWNGNVTRYSYHADGNLSSQEYPNGIKASYSYDDAGRLTRIETKTKEGVLLNAQQFALDPAGNHLSEEYKGQVVPEFVWAESNSSAAYDAGNRQKNLDNISFKFDKNGDLAQRGDLKFEFDQAGMLLSVGNDYLYEYDALDNRIAATQEGVRTNYVLDILGMSRVLLEETADGEPLNAYVYGLGLVSREDASGNTRFYHSDFRGSTLFMTNEAAEVTHAYSYGPYGRLLKGGTLAEGEAPNVFRFVGSYGVMDEGNGFYFMRARYYDVAAGRFISEDPIWHENLYDYAGGNPVMNVDHSGKKFNRIVDGLIKWEQSIKQGANSNPIKSLDHFMNSKSVYDNSSLNGDVGKGVIFTPYGIEINSTRLMAQYGASQAAAPLASSAAVGATGGCASTVVGVYVAPVCGLVAYGLVSYGASEAGGLVYDEVLEVGYNSHGEYIKEKAHNYLRPVMDYIREAIFIQSGGLDIYKY